MILVGCFVSLFPVVAVDLVGKHNVSKSVGLAFTMGSIGALFSSPLSGKLTYCNKTSLVLEILRLEPSVAYDGQLE